MLKGTVTASSGLLLLLLLPLLLLLFLLLLSELFQAAVVLCLVLRFAGEVCIVVVTCNTKMTAGRPVQDT